MSLLMLPRTFTLCDCVNIRHYLRIRTTARLLESVKYESVSGNGQYGEHYVTQRVKESEI